MKFYVRYCLGAIRIRAGQGVIGLLRTRSQLAAARGRSLVEQEVRGAEALFSRRGGAHAYVVEDICDLAYGNLYAIARRDAREALPEGLDEIGTLLLEAVLTNVGLNGVSGNKALDETAEVDVEPNDGVAADLLACPALKLVHGALDLVE